MKDFKIRIAPSAYVGRQRVSINRYSLYMCYKGFGCFYCNFIAIHGLSTTVDFGKPNNPVHRVEL